MSCPIMDMTYIPVKDTMKGFFDFVRQQGVVNLAIGFILGGAVTKLVTSLVTDVINPLVGVVMGAAGDLTKMTLKMGPIEVRWGNFVNSMIDFIIIAAVVYFGVKLLKLDKIDKKKDVPAPVPAPEAKATEKSSNKKSTDKKEEPSSKKDEKKK